MRFTARLPDIWPTANEGKSQSSWRRVFSRSHRRTASGSSTASSDISSTESRSISYSDTSTRAPTPEMSDVFDAPAAVFSPPPAFKERSPLRQRQRPSISTSVSAYHYDGHISNLYPAPLSVRTRPSTSSSAYSPTSSMASWNSLSRSSFASTHPALSPLPDSTRPQSIFSQREYEPTIYEEPDYIRLEDQDQLILTLTSKYPTGVAADLYVPVDVSMPSRSSFRRRPISMFAGGSASGRRSYASSML